MKQKSYSTIESERLIADRYPTTPVKINRFYILDKVKKGQIDGFQNPISRRWRVTETGIQQLIEAFQLDKFE